MEFFVNKVFYLIITGAMICSCVDFKATKGDLKFSMKQVAPVVDSVKKPIEIGPNFESLYENLVKKSCLDCHNSKVGVVSFESKDEFIDNADNMKFYIEFGCDLGTCMPPQDASGNPVKPVPSEELMMAFGDWIDNGYEDL